MSSQTTHVGPSKAALIIGWAMSVLPSLLLLMSGVMKVTHSEAVVKGMPDSGWDLTLAVPLGIVEIACTLIYLVPRTSILGAILLTGYLGGAIATHVRLHEMFIIPVVMGVVIWGALWLREPRLRELIPLRS
jgi:hypothetical protein